jgi:long-chain acyl-CoA synthetase
MEVDKFNNLLELYDFQYKNSKSDDEFLISLQNLKNTYTWEEAHQNIIKLSNQLNSIIKKNDRCMLISENRPEWLIADLAIMLASGVTVPAYTTYKSKDYEYLIDDCKPAVIIISNRIQYNKIKDFIKNRKFIKKSFLSTNSKI